jgi:selenocysteine lyase/cysteine desulfurase
MLDKYINLPTKIKYKLVYKSGNIDTPFIKKLEIINADYTASGQPSPFIDKYIMKNINPYYSNTHSNANNGIYMKNLILETKEYLRKVLNINNDYIILFPGNGTTAAINHLSNLINYKKYGKVVIFISIYEHYSNFLPWLKMKNTHNNIILEYISLKNELLDLEYLDNKLNYYYSNKNKFKTLIICSIMDCSNVTGLKLPLTNIKNILNKYQNNDLFHKYLFVDFACSAPYIDIDSSQYDAIFFSPHKFIGGVSTPGVLIGRKCLFMYECPYTVGGGCVKKSNNEEITYDINIEAKESAGTPNIIGIIKLKEIFELKENFKHIIINNENILNKILKKKLIYLMNKYDNFKMILYDINEINRLPIIAFSIENLHYNLVVILFNDLFGIQTRGGISCCGLLADYIYKKYNIKGWCRISFHWIMDINTILKILNSLEYIIKYGHQYIKYYTYDNNTNLYKYNNNINL